MPMFQAKNVKIGGRAVLYEVHGDAVIFQFGDGHYTEHERAMIRDHLSNTIPFKLPDINDMMRTHSLTQSIITLPRSMAVFNDYQNKKKSGPCFKGTREALLRDMADWVTGSSETRMYVLSGLAGIGKSTVAYTIASRTADLSLLGASFFFSRDEDDRKNAQKFFTTTAYQLCVYDETFAKAIGDVLLTERGSAATTKSPQEQLRILIVDPLRSIVQSRTRPILIVVDALDECDEEDERAVVMGLSHLVRLLPTFKVILTTRPQPLVDYLFANHDGHKIFHLQDIEDKVVDGDIRLYLSHCLSQEQVRACLRNPKERWSANDEEIEYLVTTAGRLFIVASTAVLYVLNKTLGDPGARMKELLGQIAQDHTPFYALTHFYSIIVRSAIQVDDGDGNILDRYQVVVGTIVVIQTPLPVATLASFIGVGSEKIYAMLRNLQSVILLGGDDVPRIYHKSFPDYLTDPARCKDRRLWIDTKTRHTWIAIRCFEMMNEHLKYNFLGLGYPARFMNNEDGLKEEGITDEQLEKRIPQQLKYACVYWANHLKVANIEDVDLTNRLAKFMDEHMLHWFEILSLTGKLDSAHLAIRVALKLLKSTSSDLHQLLSDGLRFISKFYELIKRSALHTYFSALPLAPTDSLLYRRYIKEAVHSVCSIDGGPEKWDALVADLSHGERVDVVKFSLDSALFFSCSEESADYGIPTEGILKILDAATGTPISTIPGHKFAVAKDFSTVASSEDNTITFFNVNGSAQSSMFTTPLKIQELALSAPLSSERSRLAAALYDGTIRLWNSRNAELINSFNGFEGGLRRPQFQFSPPGTRLACSSANGIVKLWDGISGRFVADLKCGSAEGDDLFFVFSGDGSRIASLSDDCRLTVWNSENGGLIGAVEYVGLVTLGVDVTELAISANGSLLATAEYYNDKVKLWSGNCDPLAQIEVPGFLRSMAFSMNDKLAIVTDPGIVKLYNVNTRSFIFTLPFIGEATALAFSLDCTHLAAGNVNGTICLWDIQGIEASGPPSEEQATRVTTLALSQDCSRLVCGFGNGKVELWTTSPTRQQITSLLTKMVRTLKLGLFRGHTESITALGFGPDGALFASGSNDWTIKLWNSRDGTLRGTLKAPDKVQAVAVSNHMVAAGWLRGVGLWTLDELNLIHDFKIQERQDILSLSISWDSSLVAIALNDPNHIRLFDVTNRIIISTFDFPDSIYNMTFLPGNSHLVAHSDDGDLYSVDGINKHVVKGPTLDFLTQLSDIPLWHGVPIWYNKRQHCLVALFSQHKTPVPVLWIPRDIRVQRWTQGSSMIALGCQDGRVILLRLPASHKG